MQSCSKELSWGHDLAAHVICMITRKPQRSRNRRYPDSQVSSNATYEGGCRTRIPMRWAIVPRDFIDTFTLDTIHSKRLLYIALANASLPELACAGFRGTSYTEPLLPPLW